MVPPRKAHGHSFGLPQVVLSLVNPVVLYVQKPNPKFCLVKQLPNLLAQPCIPKLVSPNLTELLHECRNVLGLWF
jgi:hypothetical protein